MDPDSKQSELEKMDPNSKQSEFEKVDPNSKQSESENMDPNSKKSELEKKDPNSKKSELEKKDPNSEQSEFDTGFNPCSFMPLEEGVQLLALIEMIIYALASCGCAALMKTPDKKTQILYAVLLVIYFVVGCTFPVLFCGSRKRKWIFCVPSAIGLLLAFLVRIALIVLWPTNPIFVLSLVLSLCEIYFIVIIVAYMKDARKRPQGPPKIPELFSEPLLPNAVSPYGEQILSTDAAAASVRRNPRFQNGFP